MGPTRLATLPRLAASLLPLAYSLFVRYGAQVRKPTFPEQLYIDFDGFFRDRASVRGRPRQFRDIATGVNANKEAFSVTRRNFGGYIGNTQGPQTERDHCFRHRHRPSMPERTIFFARDFACRAAVVPSAPSLPAEIACVILSSDTGAPLASASISTN